MRITARAEPCEGPLLVQVRVPLQVHLSGGRVAVPPSVLLPEPFWVVRHDADTGTGIAGIITTGDM